MQVKVIKTRPMLPPEDNLYRLLDKYMPRLPEQSVVAVTSKIVAIHQGRCVPLSRGIEREALTHKEADWYAPRDIVPGEHILFSIKDNVMIASAGIDKSNAKEHMILWPEKPMKVAAEIGQRLVKRWRLKDLGVIITDSHVTMMRRGTMGVAIGWWGFNPVRDYRGRPDIFGRELVVQTSNVADALAAAAVMEMGEGREQTPLAVITQVKEIEFSQDREVIAGKPALKVPMREDLFEPMLAAVPWQKGRGGITKEELKKMQRG